MILRTQHSGHIFTLSVLVLLTILACESSALLSDYNYAVKRKFSSIYYRNMNSSQYSPVVAFDTYGGISKAFVSSRGFGGGKAVYTFDLQDPFLYSSHKTISNYFGENSFSLIYEYQLPISLWLTDPKRGLITSLVVKGLQKTFEEESSESEDEVVANLAQSEVFTNRITYLAHAPLEDVQAVIRCYMPCNVLGVGIDSTSDAQLNVSSKCVDGLRPILFYPKQLYSDGNGRYKVMLRFNMSSTALPPNYVNYTASVNIEGDTYESSAAAVIGAQRGISIVSDVDDTIKISQVNDKIRLLKNTFLREFRAVKQMNTLYNGWKQQSIPSSGRTIAQTPLPDPYSSFSDEVGGTATSFHYVSGSPLPLFATVSQFLQEFNFPVGSLHLKNFTRSRAELIKSLESTSTVTHKVQIVTDLISRFPNRNFVLVGDSTERDPETYGMLARAFPSRIKCIFIRLVEQNSSDSTFSECAEVSKTCENLTIQYTRSDTKKSVFYSRLKKTTEIQTNHSRFEEAFKLVPTSKWRTFSDAKELEGLNLATGQCY